MPPGVLVTGASSGIGRATATVLALAGWRVFAGVRDLNVGTELARSDASPGSIEAVRLDVTDEGSIAAAKDSIVERLGGDRLGGLVNNAGVGFGGPLEFVRLDDLREQLEVNLIGQVAVTQSMLPLLREGRGRIVLISSDNGRWAPPFMGPYVASKFALEGIGDALRLELRRSGISVSIVEPGSIKTSIWDKGLNQLDDLDLPPEAMSNYGDVAGVLRQGLEQGEKNAIPPERVAEAIQDALTAKRPRARYRVGRDAKAMIALRSVLPDRVFDSLVHLIVKRLEKGA
jgi:NAD(P)-dependent dehydrogenase (short-subunit alcohol dehydrogenase family)